MSAPWECRCAFRWLGLAVGAVKEQLAPLLDQVGRRCGAGLSFPDVFIQAATAAKGKASSRHFEMVDAAIHRTGAAGKSTGALHLRCGQGQKIRRDCERVVRALQRQQGHAQRAEQLRAGRDHDLAADAMSEGVADGAIQSDAALQKNFFADVARSLDSVEIIAGDGVNQPGDDVLARLVLLAGRCGYRS